MVPLKCTYDKSWLLTFMCVTLLFLSGCESSYKEIIYFDSATFTVSGIEATDTTLLVTGSITNNCNYSYEAPWYLGFSIIPQQGGSDEVLASQIEMNSPLECNSSANWEARYEFVIFTNQATTGYEITDFEAFYILD